jgi:hypothetical protein
LAELQQQMRVERAERERATELARRMAVERDQAVAYAQEAERRGVSTYELYNEDKIKATTEHMEALAREGEQAMQDGDFKRAAALNLQIGRLGGNLAVLERDQLVLQQQRQQMSQPRQPQQPQQAELPADPFERAIRDRSEPTKRFLRQHPHLVRQDGTITKAALDAHESARDAGYQIDTPAYFQHIEQQLNGGEQQQQREGREQRGPAPPVPPGRAPTTAAPVERGGGTSVNGVRGGTFEMTPYMRRLAEEQGVTPQEWARNYVRLLDEGRIQPITQRR